MNIKDAFQAIFPLSLIPLLRKLKFLITTIDFPQVMLVAKLCLTPVRVLCPDTVALHVHTASDLRYSNYNVREEVTLKLRN